MSANEAKTWLVAYDICEPRRLRQVHKALRKQGLAAQYSAFTVEANDKQILELLERVRSLIDERADDVRAYHVPARCEVWRLGYQAWPDCVTLTPAGATRMVLEPAISEESEAWIV